MATATPLKQHLINILASGIQYEVTEAKAANARKDIKTAQVRRARAHILSKAQSGIAASNIGAAQ